MSTRAPLPGDPVTAPTPSPQDRCGESAVKVAESQANIRPETYAQRSDCRLGCFRFGDSSVVAKTLDPWRHQAFVKYGENTAKSAKILVEIPRVWLSSKKIWRPAHESPCFAPCACRHHPCRHRQSGPCPNLFQLLVVELVALLVDLDHDDDDDHHVDLVGWRIDVERAGNRRLDRPAGAGCRSGRGGLYLGTPPPRRPGCAMPASCRTGAWGRRPAPGRLATSWCPGRPPRRCGGAAIGRWCGPCRGRCGCRERGGMARPLPASSAAGTG